MTALEIERYDEAIDFLGWFAADIERKSTRVADRVLTEKYFVEGLKRSAEVLESLHAENERLTNDQAMLTDALVAAQADARILQMENERLRAIEARAKECQRHAGTWDSPSDSPSDAPMPLFMANGQTQYRYILEGKAGEAESGGSNSR